MKNFDKLKTARRSGGILMMRKRKVDLKYDEFASESYDQDDVAGRDDDVDD